MQNDHTFTKMSDGDSMYYDGGVFSPLRQGPVGNLSFSLDPIMQSSPKNPGRGIHSGETAWRPLADQEYSSAAADDLQGHQEHHQVPAGVFRPGQAAPRRVGCVLEAAAGQFRADRDELEFDVAKHGSATAGLLGSKPAPRISLLSKRGNQRRGLANPGDDRDQSRIPGWDAN